MKLSPLLSLVPCLILVAATPAEVIAMDVPVRGTSGLARIHNQTGQPRLAKFRSRAPKRSSFALPAPGSAGDPTIAGGSYRKCRYPTDGDCTKIDLPASRWSPT